MLEKWQLKTIKSVSQVNYFLDKH